MGTAVRKLEPTTLIPPELYVERSADRQLKQTIAAMGRPGYILVARQMGKTNLLVNMMREFEADVVLYHDLSARFPSARAWFRHIIDSLLERYSDEFRPESLQIREDRIYLNSEPNVEYDRHIRLLLRAINRRIIIVLDEIDSLLNAAYSDSIMAQIRSMYFSRVNFPEYKRLTYVLSGVVEPSELIKDKNISPFNIGEKILLEDFTYDEFRMFLTKAELTLPEVVQRRIYEWAEGNPRMTWDIAAALEDYRRSPQEITVAVVDSVVQQLYLTNFDRAPVDHIRTLAQSDPLIRNAIHAIRHAEADTIDDRTRSRLYLSGITRAVTGADLRIKNKIIEAALSDRWLEQIASSGRAVLSAANESFRERRYSQAALQFKVFFETAGVDEISRALPEDRMNFALAKLWSGDHAGAIAEFAVVRTLVKEPAPLQTLELYLALAYAGVKSYLEAIAHLQAAADGPSRLLAFQAQIVLLTTKVKVGHVNGTQALALGKQLIDAIESGADLEEGPRNELLLSAMHTQISILTKSGMRDEALALIARAKAIGMTKAQPALAAAELQAVEAETDRRQIARDLSMFIISQQIPFEEEGALFGFTQGLLAFILARLSSLSLHHEFDMLLDYASRQLYGGRSKAEVLKTLVNEVITENEAVDALLLAEHALSSRFNLSAPDRLELLRILVSAGTAEPTRARAREYLDLLKGKGPDIEEEDVEALARILLAYKTLNDLQAIQIVQGIWRGIEGVAFDRFPASAVIFVLQEMVSLRDLGAVELAKEPALRLLKALEVERVASSFSEYLPQFRKQANAILSFHSPSNDPYRKLGRNQVVTVVYPNKSAIQRKFKHVEGDLRAGRCVLLDPPMGY